MVLVEGYADKSDESAMVLGCSEIIALVPTASHQVVPNTRAAAEPPEIRNITTSFVSASSLFVAVHLSPVHADVGKCTITLSAYSVAKPITQHRLNCTAPWTTVTDLPAERSYQICASIGSKFPKDDEETMVCTSVDGSGNRPAPPEWFFLLGAKSYTFLLSATLTALIFLFMLLAYRTACKVCKKPVSGGSVQTHQCFLPVPPMDGVGVGGGGGSGGGAQRPRYVKLQATTVL